MIQTVRKTVTNNLVLKCMALILGSGLWLMISSLHTSTQWIEVPISFYNEDDTITLIAPETIWVQLSGNRSALRSINQENLVAHIDAQTLHEGKSRLALESHHLFLPDSIRIVGYSPLPTFIEKTTHNIHKKDV